ncbi:hypothetical protein FB550_111111 [Neobacillus bataviensis]|uniref:Spore coat protein B n=1 Tax=Neobacillus bataviensis TaxID=220685 RepID=A0A561CZI7_9BACI|nr:hypothetical protein [Neobacillus bataviensis]TWD96454.1 hypothetical protein FB550_111111 [Neobacillus bataviensis]
MGKDIKQYFTNKVIKVDRGGPESRIGKVLDAGDDYFAVLTEDDGVVYYHTQHIKSFTENRNMQLEFDVKVPKDFEFKKAENFKELLESLNYLWVRINRGGPDMVEGVLIEVKDDFVYIVTNDEVVRITIFHIKNVSCGPKIEKAKTEDHKSREPKSLKPKSLKPKSLKPNSPKPNSLKPNSPKPNSPKPKSLQPESLQHESLQPESLQHESLQHESLQPESLQHESLPFESLQDESLPYESLTYESLLHDSQPYQSLQHDSQPYESLQHDSQPYESLQPDSQPYESLQPDSQPYISLQHDSQLFESLQYESLPYESPQKLNDESKNKYNKSNLAARQNFEVDLSVLLSSMEKFLRNYSKGI